MQHSLGRLFTVIVIAALQVGCPGAGTTLQAGPSVYLQNDGIVDGASGLELRFDHSVGATSCPQHLDTWILENGRGTPVAFTITGGGAAVSVDPSGGTIAPGEAVEITVRFTCSMPSDVSETLTIELRDEDGSSLSTTTIHVIGRVS